MFKFDCTLRDLGSRLIALLTLCGLLLTAPLQAQDPDAEALVDGLHDVFTRLESLSRFEEFAEALPLTSVEPAAALGLDRVFQDALGLAASTCANLASEINALDGFSNASVDCSGSPASVSFDVAKSATVTLPLDVDVATGGIDSQLEGGDLGIAFDFRFQGLRFELDTSLTDANERFYLAYSTTPPTATLTVMASNANTQFDANLGFVQVEVVPTVTFDVGIEAQLNDPDSNDQVTSDEWTMTALDDLFTVRFDELLNADETCANPTDVVQANIALSADVGGQTLSGTIGFSDKCLSDGFDNLDYTSLGKDLSNFGSVSPTTVLQGLSVLASSIRSAQVVGEMPLPFIEEGLAEAFTFAQPVVEFVERLGLAAIICGTINEDPPRGNILDAEPGDPLYCQAITLSEPSSLTWRVKQSGNGTLQSGAADLDTVGSNPTATAVFITPADGSTVDVELAFTATDGTSHVVNRGFLSVQEMVAQLIDSSLFSSIGAFDNVADLVAYDGTNDAVTFHLRKSFDPGAAAGFNLDFADQLKTDTNLAGLSSSASVTLDPGAITLDVTFGLALGDDPDPLVTDPDPTDADPITADRFFIRRSGSEPLVALSDLGASVDVELEGSIGFVEVTATGNSAVNGEAFKIGKGPAGDNLLEIDVDYSGIDSNDRIGGLTDAIRFRQLLRELERIQPTFNLEMKGGLDIVASADSVELGRGSVGLEWTITGNDASSVGRPTITATQDFTDRLQGFDVEPAVTGDHSGADGADTLTASGAPFVAADLVNTTLKNLRSREQCTVGPNDVLSTSQIRCTKDDGNQLTWNTGDSFEVGGNKLALLSIILDNLDLILLALDQTPILDTELPLVSRTPRQLISQLEDLRDQLQEFRSLTPQAQIVCNAWEVPTAAGSFNRLVNLQAGDKVYCQATQLDESLLDEAGDVVGVEWTLRQGGSSTSISTDTATVLTGSLDLDPAKWVEFTITENGSDPGDDTDDPTQFQVALTVEDAERGSHPVTFPEMALTLQNLSEILGCYVGLPEGILELSIDDLVPPSGGAAERHLVVGLDYGVCSDGNSHPDLACGRADLRFDKLEAAVRVPLPEEFQGSELIGIDSSESQISLQVRAGAGLDLAIPFSNPTSPAVVDTSGLELRAFATAGATDPLAITGNVGPLKLEIAAQAQIGAKIAVAPEQEATPKLFALTDSSFLDAVKAGAGFMSLETPPTCTGIEYTPVVVETSGQHDGSAAATNLTDTTSTFPSTYSGLTLRNKTDGSTCTITAVTASTQDAQGNPGPLDTLECQLADGKTNQWSAGDDYAVESEGTAETLGGDVCAGLSVALDLGSGSTLPLGDVGFEIDQLAGNVPRLASDELTVDGGWFLAYPDSLLDNVSLRDLDLTTVLTLLPTVMDNIAAAMESAESAPLIGDGLKDVGGAIDNVNEEVVRPLTEAALEVLTATAGEMTAEVQGIIWTALGEDGNPLLPDGRDSIIVRAFCDSTSAEECDDDATIDTINDLRIRIELGQFGEPNPNVDASTSGVDTAEAGTETLEIDFGVPGLPIEARGDLTVSFGWRLPLEFGLGRNTGLYVVTSPDDDCPMTAADSGTSLRLGVSVEIDGPDDEDLQDGFACPSLDLPTSDNGPYSTSRCVYARLGFLDTYLYDSDDPDKQSFLNLFAFTDLKSSAGSTDGGGAHIVPLCELMSGLSLEAGLRGEARANLGFRTGIAGTGSEELPSVLGEVNLDAGFQFPSDPDNPNGVRDVGYGNLHLDPGGFIEGLLGPAAKNVREVTRPLKPVIDTVQTPLPVVSDLSDAVGNGPITLLSLIELRSCPPPRPDAPCTKLLRNVLDVIEFASSVVDDFADGTPIALGDFAVDVDEMRAGNKTPDQAGTLVNYGSANTKTETVKSDDLAQPKAGKKRSRIPDTISFPFLGDSSQIFSLIMGQDIDLMRFDAGTMSATAGFQYTFGPFAVGPIPVEVSIGGSATLEARFAMGYDTSGIRKALEGGSGLAIVDGIFIDDLDADGQDVPEVRLIGEITAGAGVSAGVVAVGLEGGITMTTDLNLDDSPDPDGKLRIDEIINKIHNPPCLFEINGKLEAFLGAWVRVGVEWFSKKWDIEFVRVTLLEFEASCDPPPPVLAEVSGNTLTLLVGKESNRDKRGIQPTRTAEKVVVRQTCSTDLAQCSTNTFEVTGFGLTQTFDIDGTPTVRADAFGGDDDIAMEDGVITDAGADGELGTDDDGDETIVTFTARLEICGGAGNDKIKAGAGTDLIYGDSGGAWCKSSDEDADEDSNDPGRDRIQAGPGADVVYAGGGDDNVSGEGGNDQLHGDSAPAGSAVCDTSADPDSDDDFTFNDVITGGPGADLICGGPGSDNLNGSWPATQGFSTDSEDLQGDDADEIAGGAGDDHIEGNFGDDLLYGDFRADGTPGSFTCGTGLAGGGIDRINGGAGDDQIWGGGNVNTDVLFETLGGELGNDFICGNDGDDLLDGDDPDILDCGDAGCHDVLAGGPGHDGLWGRLGNDRLFGGDGNDELFGADGFDDLIGGGGRDLLYGEGDNDVLLGDGGDLSNPTGATAANRGRTPSVGDPGAAPLDSAVGFALSSVTRTQGAASDDSVAELCFTDGDIHSIPRLGTATGWSDCLIGGDGHDLLFGELGQDGLFGQDGDDYLEGGTGDDTLRGGQGDDVVYGFLRAGLDSDDWRDPASTVAGDPGLSDDDELFGDSGSDDLYGGPRTDTLRGGIADDYLEGNQAADILFGDAGQDDVIGGSSVAGTDDTGRDELFGNADHDVLVGDNAKITRLASTNAFDDSQVRLVELLDLGTEGDGDVLRGNPGNDRLWGGTGDDEMHGDQGDDVLAGNMGDDTMYGDLGQDDLIGGSGRRVICTGAEGACDSVTPSHETRAAAEAANRADGADEIYGGDGSTALDDDYDVIAGDNALIDRVLDDAGQWEENTFNGSVKRDVYLLDVATVTTDAPSGTFDGDRLRGEADDDVIYGQGGDDHVLAGLGDDLVMGNAGTDEIHGDEGSDDLVGGTGRINDDAASGEPGRLDAHDVIYGGAGFDVIAGDNAVIARVLDGGAWVSNTFDGGLAHERRILLDIDSPDTARVSGPDVLYGDADNDLMYGQGANDEMHGNAGDDLMEGNHGADTMTGDSGQDDMIGGTTEAAVTDDDDATLGRGDLMDGNEREDVMIGDNGTIGRPLASGRWQRFDATTGAFLSADSDGAVVRDVVLFDVERADGTSVDVAFSGADQMRGQDGHDRIYGQGADDQVWGGDGYDLIEGNHGADTLLGEAGEDDVMGGSSAGDGRVDVAQVPADGLADGDDHIEGGGEGDVIAGDNARVTRPLAGDGRWYVDPNVDDVLRAVVLFDVELAGAPAPPAASGSDRIFGQDGRDLLFGQGNADPSDDDGDGRFSEDPRDGVDNDHDGRESVASVGYDCADGVDNDGDGVTDGADGECLVAIDEDLGGDEMHGGAGVDYMEGNHGSDWMFGDDGEDDMIGGSSAGDGVIGGGVPPAGLADGDDVMEGGNEDDVLVADNAIVNRVLDAGLWRRHVGGVFNLAARVTEMSEVPELTGAFGHDYALGNAGEDEIYGQQGNDYLEGNFGSDALVGDLGQVTTRFEDGSRQRTIETNSPFLSADVFVAGTLSRIAELYSHEDGDGAEGHDVLLGGDGDDHLHGGPGDDLANGDGDGIPTAICEDPFTDPSDVARDADVVFGGDGNDALWGGRGDDHVFGGYGDDHLDVKPREARAATRKDPAMPADPPEWFTWGGPDNFQGFDILHGGYDRDAMQADVGGPGPQPGDRMIDWTGGFNAFFVCPAAYGAGYIDRMQGPDMDEFIHTLAEGGGAFDPSSEGTSGFREVGYVFHQDNRFNSHPPHPTHPGHFTCACEEEDSGNGNGNGNGKK